MNSPLEIAKSAFRGLGGPALCRRIRSRTFPQPLAEIAIEFSPLRAQFARGGAGGGATRRARHVL